MEPLLWMLGYVCIGAFLHGALSKQAINTTDDLATFGLISALWLPIAFSVIGEMIFRPKVEVS